MAPSSHDRYVIKVCGVTTEADALAASEAGATAIGLNFYRRSPRYITPEAASKISVVLPPSVLRVGVFVSPVEEDVFRIAAEGHLDVVQIHGSFVAENLTGLRVWKAVAVDAAFASESLLQQNVEAFLLDAPTAGYGGSGRTFEWSRIGAMTAPFLLAGGLDASNVSEAISRVKPWGVDACSRLESAPGKKDIKKLRDFVEAAERGFAALERIGELVR
jgi:phosphoribosylanthranilate isomerase